MAWTCLAWRGIRESNPGLLNLELRLIFSMAAAIGEGGGVSLDLFDTRHSAMEGPPLKLSDGVVLRARVAGPARGAAMERTWPPRHGPASWA